MGTSFSSFLEARDFFEEEDEELEAVRLSYFLALRCPFDSFTGSCVPVVNAAFKSPRTGFPPS
jgi:hypothetical protein